MKQSMLRWSIFILLLATIISTSVISSSVSAQEQSPPSNDGELRRVHSKILPPSVLKELERMHNQQRPRKSKGQKQNVHPRLQRNLKWIDKLEYLIHEKMKLTTDQLGHIDAVISNHVKLVSTRWENNISLTRIPDNQTDNLQSAKKSLDNSTYDPAKKKFLVSAQGSKYELIMNHMGELLNDIKAVFPEEHKKEFEELILLWDVTNHGAFPDGPLKRINRIVKSPIILVTLDIRDKMSILVSAAMKKLGPQRKQDKADQRKAYEKLKKDIYELLTQEDRLKVDKALKFIDDDARAWEARENKQRVKPSKADE